MKKMGMPVAILVLFAIMLSGCGQSGVPKDIRESTLVIDKSGRVTAYLVEEFDKNYYNISELSAMVQEDAANFGGSEANSKQVKIMGVDAMEGDSSRVVVTYRFDDTGSYEELIKDQLFYGTVAEAIQRGYAKGVTLQSVQDGTLMTETDLMQNLGEHLVIFYPEQVQPDQVKLNPEAEEQGQIVIYCPDKVEFVSQGAVVNQDGSISITWVEGSDYEPVYILLKK